VTSPAVPIDTPPLLIDTHCHLDPEHCGDGPEPLLARARAGGVGGVICVGVGGAEQARFAARLAAERPDVVATVGVHPHDAAQHTEALAEELTALLAHPRVVAVGEVGLDYHYDHSPREEQRRIFARYIALARQLRLPLVIHTRSAAQDTLELLRSEGAADVGGVIHCFSEDREFARVALELGFFLSFSGIVTFKKATEIQEVAAWAPLDRILVETDSPYLAPIPFRGKVNEPAYVVHTARFVGQLRGLSLEEVAAATTDNARTLFGLPAQFGAA
jgi:TatD DNase family protein